MIPELTNRELEVLEGMADGLSNADIGNRLYLGEDTVKTHARGLFRKLGISDRAGAVSLGYRWGLLGTGDDLAQHARRAVWNVPDTHIAACFAAHVCLCRTRGGTVHSRACLLAPACPCRIKEARAAA